MVPRNVTQQRSDGGEREYKGAAVGYRGLWMGWGQYVVRGLCKQAERVQAPLLCKL